MDLGGGRERGERERERERDREREGGEGGRERDSHGNTIPIKSSPLLPQTFVTGHIFGQIPLIFGGYNMDICKITCTLMGMVAFTLL